MLPYLRCRQAFTFFVQEACIRSVHNAKTVDGDGLTVE